MFRFQALLIIFLATIRLQSRGGAVYDPSVGGADSSPQGEPRAMACGAVLFASPAKGRWGRRKAHGSVGSRFFQQLRQRPLSRRPLRFASEPPPLAGEAMTIPLAGEPATQSMRLFTAASIYSHTPRKFLFTSLFGMRRTVKP